MQSTGFRSFRGGSLAPRTLSSQPASKVRHGQFDKLISSEPMAGICKCWPDAYPYATYCLRPVHAILARDFDVRLDDNPYLKEVRLWEPSRENVRQDRDAAIGFFDVFIGVEPNWSFTQHFSSRPAVRAAILTVKEKVRAGLASGYREM